MSEPEKKKRAGNPNWVKGKSASPETMWKKGQSGNPEMRWKKGYSANPTGWNRSARQIENLLNLIEQTAGAEDAISRAWLKQLLNGSFPHLKEFLERRDGKVPSQVAHVEATSNDFITIIEAAARETKTEQVNGTPDQVLE